MPIFLYLDLVKIRLEIMFNYFEKKKDTLFDYKKQNQSPKNRIFVKGVTLCFWPENVIFFLSLDLIKIRLEIKLLNLQ